jgi:hypothetical protein
LAPLNEDTPNSLLVVDISHETIAETEARLGRVFSASTLKILEETYSFSEFPVDTLRVAVAPDALALVRDDETWSQLVPSREGASEAFTIFRFHFPAGMDNSGFVGWLATHLKRRLGTGVFVVCGYNSARGGIFDYWGCPASLREELLFELDRLARETCEGQEE